MSDPTTVQTTAYLDILEKIATDVIAPAAAEIDQTGKFPRAALDALGRAGLLGLISAPEVGGMGLSIRAATSVVQRIARECASTAMIVCMHYAGTAVIEAANGPREIRQAIAAGKHLTTLAFSEAGSRSHFWAPVSTAVGSNGTVTLNANKSWATSAAQADSYVWSSRPLGDEGMSTIWLVPGSAQGLHVPTPFDGLGLRGNYSSPVAATNVSPWLIALGSATIILGSLSCWKARKISERAFGSTDPFTTATLHDLLNSLLNTFNTLVNGAKTIIFSLHCSMASCNTLRRSGVGRVCTSRLLS